MRAAVLSDTYMGTHLHSQAYTWTAHLHEQPRSLLLEGGVPQYCPDPSGRRLIPLANSKEQLVTLIQRIARSWLSLARLERVTCTLKDGSPVFPRSVSSPAY